jgi:tetratricopeptide (TPR) repeat protein
MRRELVARLAAALNLQLVHAEAVRAEEASGAALEAADLVMQARDAGGANWTPAGYQRARELYDAALALDPHNAEALARRASLLASLANAWPGPGIDAQIAQAEADATRALQHDSLLPTAHLALSHVRQQQYRLEEAAAAADQALELDPNAVMALQWRAELHRYAGESAQGLPLLQRALVLSPRDPARWIFYARMGWLLVHLGRHEDAQPWLERSLALHAHWTTHMATAVVLAQQGQFAEARTHLPALATPEALTHRRWNRVSRHPVFLRESREQVFAPLLRCGALPGPEAVQAWEARQQGGGRPLDGFRPG